MTISTRTRFEVLKRDGFKCRYCGRTSMSVVLHVDHVVPVSGGGSDEPINLIAACADCNLGKSNVSLEDSRLAERANGDELVEHAAQVRDYLERVKELQAAKEEVYMWLSQTYEEHIGEPPLVDLHKRWRAILDQHSIESVVAAIEATGRKFRTAYKGRNSGINQMRYLYGVLRKLREEPPE